MFLSCRKRYWTEEGHELPGLERVVVAFVEMEEYEGRHIYDPRNPDHIHFIVLGADLMDDEEEVEQVLLHEMAHLAVYDQIKNGNSHAQPWRTEMARLVKLGAVRLD